MCVVISFSGCQSQTENNLEKGLMLDFEAQYIRTNGYVDEVRYPIILLINTTEELEEYYKQNRDTYDLERKEKVYSDTTIGFLDAVDKYDDIYFKDNILVFILLEEGSGSVGHDISGVKLNEKAVEIGIERIVPEVGTDDMAQWHVMVELKRDTYNDSEIKVIYSP